MFEIADLLEKLKPLDRNLYDGLKLVQAQLGRMDLLCSDDIFADFVQGEVQRAIAANGWAYQVSYTFQGAPFGEIITKNEDGTKTFRPDQAGSSPASALLHAYITCLESHP